MYDCRAPKNSLLNEEGSLQKKSHKDGISRQTKQPQYMGNFWR